MTDVLGTSDISPDGFFLVVGSGVFRLTLSLLGG